MLGHKLAMKSQIYCVPNLTNLTSRAQVTSVSMIIGNVTKHAHPYIVYLEQSIAVPSASATETNLSLVFYMNSNHDFFHSQIYEHR